MMRRFLSLCFTAAFAIAPCNINQANASQSAPYVNTTLQTPALNTVCMVGDSVTIASNVQIGQTFTASGGTAPYTFSVTGLPSGVNQSVSSPSITFAPGIPTIETASVAITVNDNASGTATYNYNLTIDESLDFTWTYVGHTGALTLVLGAQTYSLNDRGPAYWINFLSGGALSAPFNLNFGHAGDTTTALLARMGPVLAAAPKCGAYALMIGTNDLNNVASPSVATIEANISSIYMQLLGTGRPVVIETILPRSLNPGTNGNSAAQLYGVNRWIKSLAGTTPNLRIVDNEGAYGDPLAYDGSPRTFTDSFTTSGGTAPYTWSATGLPANVSIATNTPTNDGTLTSAATVASTQTVTLTATDSASHTGSAQYVLSINPQLSNPISLGANGVTSGTLPISRLYDYSYDGLHPKSAGAYAAFAPLEEALMQAISPAGAPTSSNIDVYDVNSNTHGNLLPNGMMTFQAATGTLSSGSSTAAAGKAPDGWTLATVDGGITGSMTATGSPAVDSLGNPAERIALTGTGQGGYETLAFLKYVTTTFANYASGAALTARCRIEVSAGAQHVSNPWIFLQYTAGGVTNTVAAGAWLYGAQWDGDNGAQDAFSGVLSTPVPALAAAGSFSGTLALWVGVNVTNSPSATIADTFTVSACSLTQ